MSPIVPIFASALAAGVFLVVQRYEIGRYEAEYESNALRIAEIKATADAEKPNHLSKRPLPDFARSGIANIPWEIIADDLSQNRQLPKWLNSLSAEEVNEVFASLDSSDIPLFERERIRLLLLNKILISHPRSALDQLIQNPDRRYLERYGDLTDTAFATLALRSATEAAEWLDNLAASGRLDSRRLDGKALLRSSFELKLIATTLVNAPEFANERMAQLSHQELVGFVDAIASYTTSLDLILGARANRRAFTELITTHFDDESERIRAYHSITKDYLGRLVDELAVFDAFVAQNTLREGDAQLLYSRALSDAECFTIQHAESNYQWATKRLPHRGARIVGEQIAQHSFIVSDKPHLETVHHLYASQSDNELLLGYASKLPKLDDATAREIFSVVTDENARAALLEQFIKTQLQP